MITQAFSRSCESCRDTGWMPTGSGVVRCECRQPRMTWTPAETTNRQVNVLAAYLKERAPKAVRRKDLERDVVLVGELGVTMKGMDRALRLIVGRANELLIPLVGDSRGYRYVQSARELDDAIGRIGAQIKAEQSRLTLLKAMREHMERG